MSKLPVKRVEPTPPGRVTKLTQLFRQMPVELLAEAAAHSSMEHVRKWGLTVEGQKNPAKYAQECGVTLTELRNAYVEFGVNMSQMVVAEKLPEVAEALVADAAGRKRTCPACAGVGAVEGISCDSCWGSGVERQPGSIESQKLVMDITKQLGGRGPLVAQQFNFGESWNPDAMVRQSTKLLGG